MSNFAIADKDKNRIQGYKNYENIFLGDHYTAFAGMFKDFGKDFSHLVYLAVNFGGMLSKLSADLLFEEPPIIRVEKENQDWLKNFMDANKWNVQLYESGLENSYRGDAVFRIRAENGKCIVEDINPESYFPVYDPSNVRKEPIEHIIANEVYLNTLTDSAGKPTKAYLIERHQKGQILNELYKVENDKITEKLAIKVHFPNIKEVEKTNINDFLIIHIKNYGINSRYFGISDYNDLTSLIYAINGRLTRIDNILNKHGDPILAVPQGVLDENGQVRKESFGLIEVDFQESKGDIPRYIVWDAKLESAFAEIDKLVEFLFMVSETNPSAFGMDKNGMAESGRALKFKLLRTLAKKHRKELYYDYGIKKIVKTAFDFSIANGLSVNGIKAKGKMETPQILWQDGIINDDTETVDIEIKKLDAGLTTKVDSIATIDSIEQDEAQTKLEQINKEEKERKSVSVNPFNPNDLLNK